MADITINLTDTKSAVLQHDGILQSDMERNNYKVIAGEQLATSFELVYDKVKYADYTFSVEIVNAAGKGVIITEGTNPQTDIVDGVFLFPIGAAVQGYAKMTVTAVNNLDTNEIVKWELIKIKVWETNPNWKEHIDPTSPYVTQEQLNVVKSELNKKPDTLKFETEEDFKEYLRLGKMIGYPNVETLADGTIFNIIEEGIPDYWWDATNQIAYEWEAFSSGSESGLFEIPYDLTELEEQSDGTNFIDTNFDKIKKGAYFKHGDSNVILKEVGKDTKEYYTMFLVFDCDGLHYIVDVRSDGAVGIKSTELVTTDTDQAISGDKTFGGYTIFEDAQFDGNAYFNGSAFINGKEITGDGLFEIPYDLMEQPLDDKVYDFFKTNIDKIKKGAYFIRGNTYFYLTRVDNNITYGGCTVTWYYGDSEVNKLFYELYLNVNAKNSSLFVTNIDTEEFSENDCLLVGYRDYDNGTTGIRPSYLYATPENNGKVVGIQDGAFVAVDVQKPLYQHNITLNNFQTYVSKDIYVGLIQIINNDPTPLIIGTLVNWLNNSKISNIDVTTNVGDYLPITVLGQDASYAGALFGFRKTSSYIGFVVVKKATRSVTTTDLTDENNFYVAPNSAITDKVTPL